MLIPTLILCQILNNPKTESLFCFELNGTNLSILWCNINISRFHLNYKYSICYFQKGLQDRACKQCITWYSCLSVHMTYWLFLRVGVECGGNLCTVCFTQQGVQSSSEPNLNERREISIHTSEVSLLLNPCDAFEYTECVFFAWALWDIYYILNIT